MDSISDSGIACAAPIAVSGISRALIAACALLLLPGAAPAPTTRLEVEVSKLRSAKGMIRVCLTADPRNFPSCTDDRHAITASVPASGHEIVFEGLSPGDYAVAVIHDENGNKKLDTLMGIPREGFGFSRNPAIGFGPPRFAAARFTLSGGDAVEDVRMRYLL